MSTLKRADSVARHFGCALLVAAAGLAPSQAQVPEQMRTICKDPALQQRIRAQAQKQDDLTRKSVEWELVARCEQLDLPATPVNSRPDATRETSHTNWIYDARYSRDGRRIVSASFDNTVRVWNAETGEPIRRIVAAQDKKTRDGTRQGRVRHAAFVADGARIVTAADANPVRLFDVASGAMIAELPFASAEPDSFPPHIATTGDGLVFLAGKNDKVDALDAGTRAVRYRLAGHGEGATAVAVAEAAGLVATAAGEEKSRVMLWRLGDGEKLAELTPAGNDRVDALAFSRDGAQLAIGVGGSVHVYALADKRLVRTLVVHPFGGVFAAAFTADGKGLISCQDHPILWDLETGKMVRRFGPFTDLCHSVDVSPDGRFAVTSSMGSDVRVWEIATGAFYRRLGLNVHPPH